MDVPQLLLGIAMIALGAGYLGLRDRLAAQRGTEAPLDERMRALRGIVGALLIVAGIAQLVVAAT
jgi:hypothetical protein